MKVEIKWYTHTLICEVELCSEGNIDNGFAIKSACLLNDLTDIIDILEEKELGKLIYQELQKTKL